MSNHYAIAIVGSGFGGLGLAAQLKEQGETSFVILEKADRVGGTWRENTYPGCCCDVPSHLYWYSFDRHPDWSRLYAGQPEIQANIEHFAKARGLDAHIRFDTAVKSARWDEAAGLWRIATAAGDEILARSLVTATGQLSEPSYRGIAGRDSFKGPSWHSATWRHDVDLTGKRVAVIGNGASAIQFIPVIQKVVGQLTVFQKSAFYVVPREDRTYSAEERSRFMADEASYQASREEIYRFYEAKYDSLKPGDPVAEFALNLARTHLENQVKDPELRKVLWPDYTIGCKRVLISDDFYPAVAQPNVSIVTDRITAVTPTGIDTADGAHRDFDVIIYATGFASQGFVGGIDIAGRSGRSLRRDAWKEGEEAYRGTMVAGFPNLFILYGPNTNLNHNSIIAMMEAQYVWIHKALALIGQTPGHAVDVRPEVMRAYNRWLGERMQRLAFVHGCGSWYKNEAGKVTNNWTETVDAYKALMDTFDPADFAQIGNPAATTV